MRYCGRDFSTPEIEDIRALISENPEFNRAQLSRHVCEKLNWRRPDERLKDMSCRVAMLRMQDEGLLHLPKPQNGNNNGRRYCRRTPQADPKLFPVNGSAGDLVDLHLELVTDRSQSHLWNEYIDRYHYLVPIPEVGF